MGPRVKKPRSGKAKDLPTSAEAEREIVEGGDDKVNEETESQDEVHKTEVDNGGEEVPPLKKGRGRQNVKKVPVKAKGAPSDEDKADEGKEKISNDTVAEENSNKASSDYDDEEAAPVKKGRGRTKRATKYEMVGKEASNGEGELKEEVESAALGAKKRRPRKKKVDDDEPEVMPKKRERGARKTEALAEEEANTDEGTTAHDSEESKLKITKREKKPPAKKIGKNKKDQDEEQKLVEDDEVNGKKGENGQSLDEQAEDEVHEIEEGAGDGKPVKKAARGKAAAKAADGAAKKPVGRGRKAAKEEELTEDNDVPVDGKKLRVLVEHCKS